MHSQSDSKLNLAPFSSYKLPSYPLYYDTKHSSYSLYRGLADDCLETWEKKLSSSCADPSRINRNSCRCSIWHYICFNWEHYFMLDLPLSNDVLLEALFLNAPNIDRFFFNWDDDKFRLFTCSLLSSLNIEVCILRFSLYAVIFCSLPLSIY